MTPFSVLVSFTIHRIIFSFLRNSPRLDPRFLIIDTNISRRSGKLIDYHLEDTSPALSAASDQPLTWVGHMTKELLEEALKSFGFEYTFFDWGNFIGEIRMPSPGIQVDYAIGTRVTVHAARRQKVLCNQGLTAVFVTWARSLRRSTPNWSASAANGNELQSSSGNHRPALSCSAQ